MAIKAISRKLRISRNAVRRALANDSPPAYSRPPKGSLVDALEPRIRELLRVTPTMPATLIAERLEWPYGLTVLKDRVRALRPFYLPPDPASRTEYDPGHRVQASHPISPAQLRCPWGSDEVLLSMGRRKRSSLGVIFQPLGFAVKVARSEIGGRGRMWSTFPGPDRVLLR